MKRMLSAIFFWCCIAPSAATAAPVDPLRSDKDDKDVVEELGRTVSRDLPGFSSGKAKKTGTFSEARGRFTRAADRSSGSRAEKPRKAVQTGKGRKNTLY